MSMLNSPLLRTWRFQIFHSIYAYRAGSETVSNRLNHKIARK